MGSPPVSPWIDVAPLDDQAFGRIRRRAIFDCRKWDPQVGDVCSIARRPLVITHAAWHDVRALAAKLASETLAAEAELRARPELHLALGMPRVIRRALSTTGTGCGVARLMRFDFHFTQDGWRISEVNSDVPGGLNEASGFPAMIASHYPWAQSVGDPVSAYVDALRSQVETPATVAFLHATAYSDDHQMMAFVADRLRGDGVATHLASPSHLRWRDGRAWLESAWWTGPLDLIVRFFPAEWLGSLPRRSGWQHLLGQSSTPISNPASAILTQSKRFPLIWDALRTPLPTWRALLPETRDPRDVPWSQSELWLLKPAFGRVGEGVGLRAVIAAKEWSRIKRSARWWPSHWIAQRRFELVPETSHGITTFPCLGVYTLDGVVIGAYGRLASVPLVDARAADAAVLAA